MEKEKTVEMWDDVKKKSKHGYKEHWHSVMFNKFSQGLICIIYIQTIVFVFCFFL